MINLTVGINNCLCALMYQIVSVLCAIKKIIYLHWFSVMDIVLYLDIVLYSVFFLSIS